MKAFSAVIAIMLFASPLPGQKLISGYVIDASTGKPLSNTNIQIENTYKGTITNSDGKFKIEIKKLPATLNVTYIGYIAKKITVTESSPSSITVKLNPTVIQLKPITVSDEDPAVNIMRKVIKHKKSWLKSLSRYRVDAYSRISLENDTSIVYIAESNSRLYWDKNKGDKEVIVSKKTSANIKNTENFAFASNLQNLYDDNIDVAGFKVIGVTNPKALKYYNFSLTNYRSFNGKTVYDIEVSPKSKLQPTFKGRISVVDEDYAIIDVDLVPSESVILPPPFQNFEIHYKQQYRKFGSLFWLPVDMRMHGLIKIGMVGLNFPKIIYNQISVFTEYSVNSAFPDSIFKSKKHIIVDSLSIRKNIMTTTPVPLTMEESSAYKNLDSTMTLNKAFKPTGFLAKYVVVSASNDAGSASTSADTKKKKRTLLSYINPRFQYNRVTGFGPGIGISLSKKHVKILASTDYYAGLKEFAWSIRGAAKLKNLSVSADCFSGAQSRFSALNYPAFINTYSCLIGETDYNDYYRNKRFRTSLKYSVSKIPASLKIGVNIETHSSLEETSTFTLTGKGKISRLNPAIDAGNLRSVYLNLSLGHDLIPFAPISQNRISFEIEHSSPDLFSSDFNFTSYRLNGNFRINTFLRRRMLAPCIDVQFTAGTYKGTLPLQKMGNIGTSIGGFMPFGVFKTLKNRPVEGEKYAAVFAEHNFRTIPFELLGLHSLARKGLGIIVFGAIGRTWMSKKALTYTPLQITDTYSESGISINGLFGIARIDFAVPLTRKGFYVGFGMARMF
ncbi:carboxypeptidase-like regulatory domain-containing protein [bacterium]|nr:carboxypeptidase-like regulatory domain-containing protein [bacterium]